MKSFFSTSVSIISLLPLLLFSRGTSAGRVIVAAPSNNTGIPVAVGTPVLAPSGHFDVDPSTTTTGNTRITTTVPTTTISPHTVSTSFPHKATQPKTDKTGKSTGFVTAAPAIIKARGTKVTGTSSPSDAGLKRNRRWFGGLGYGLPYGGFGYGGLGYGGLGFGGLGFGGLGLGGLGFGGLGYGGLGFGGLGFGGGLGLGGGIVDSVSVTDMII
ncbi:uncharacterized protein LOC129586469 [Paramacrobiotus metropolitanus]|uniref:uncharacterized protein LOC129586469 n=1 Tax=Paramacrobiotus metropolitanus TaxID=2943436 RepID=UPI0024464DEC|nr:uncharacterized protein LOC129586469 [Paramacrobiotus metropolitanus]